MPLPNRASPCVQLFNLERLSRLRIPDMVALTRQSMLLSSPNPSLITTRRRRPISAEMQLVCPMILLSQALCDQSSAVYENRLDHITLRYQLDLSVCTQRNHSWATGRLALPSWLRNRIATRSCLVGYVLRYFYQNLYPVYPVAYPVAMNSATCKKNTT